jgi:hypothetical protein
MSHWAIKGRLSFLILPVVVVLAACSSSVSPDQRQTPTASSSPATVETVEAPSFTEEEALNVLGQDAESLEQVAAVDSTRRSDLVPWSKLPSAPNDTTIGIAWWDAAEGCVNTVRVFALTETPTEVVIDLQRTGATEAPTCPDSQSLRRAEIELSSPLADRTVKYHRPARHRIPVRFKVDRDIRGSDPLPDRLRG